MHLKVN